MQYLVSDSKFELTSSVSTISSYNDIISPFQKRKHLIFQLSFQFKSISSFSYNNSPGIRFLKSSNCYYLSTFHQCLLSNLLFGVLWDVKVLIMSLFLVELTVLCILVVAVVATLQVMWFNVILDKVLKNNLEFFGIPFHYSSCNEIKMKSTETWTW